MKITCVYDEGSKVGTPMIGAKGFSMLVESDGKRVLFDTGLRDRYLQHNMEHLEIPYDSIDAVVISQAHPDNCRALQGLLEQRTAPVDVYAPAGLYDSKRGLLSNSIGLSEECRTKATLHHDDGWKEIAPKVWMTPRLASADGYREAFLVVEGKKLTVLSGRAHDGPSAVLDAVKGRFGRDARSFIGAVLLEKKGKQIAEQYAATFDSHGCTGLRLNHCTGRDGITNLRTHFGLKGVDDFYVGDAMEI